LLEFYAAFVRQIESGQRSSSWGDSSVDLEVPILSKHVKQDLNSKAQSLQILQFLVCFICHTELIDNLFMLSHSVKCGQAEELSG
jgi:hypothetical protein